MSLYLKLYFREKMSDNSENSKVASKRQLEETEDNEIFSIKELIEQEKEV